MRRLILVAFGLMLLAARVVAADRPNVLWIYVEDMNDWMGCYGQTIIETPHIDALAREGVRFDRVYMPAGVCSATRSALITGTMQTTFGLHNHRSARPVFRGKDMGDDFDDIRLPDGVQTVPELFKAAGYYTFNEGKDDYNFVYRPNDLYDRKTDRMGFKGAMDGSEWSGREADQPFFGQIQLRGGKHNPKRVVDPQAVFVPPYYPDHPAIREEIAKHYDCVLETDREVGQIVAKLKADGLYKNTAIFFFTDHGMKLPRHKQFLYEGGVKVPLIVAWAEGHTKASPGTSRPDLVSGIDIPVTSLALAGIEVPKWMEGRDVFASNHQPRTYVISARDRCDYTIDHIRAVRTTRYRYLRNFLTDRPYMQPQYRDNTPFVLALKALYEAGELNAVQARFMGPTRPAEELYDLYRDPYETNNLAEDPAYAGVLAEHRDILQTWMATTDDKGQYPESDAGLRAVLRRWGDQCVNPEYDHVRN